MTAVSIALGVLGSLGVFVFGLKVMSEALQKVVGARLKAVLARTSNPVSGVLTGFATTCVVQSSSATTVMVVGFITAGLLTLTQALGVIMGANIGTTITGWLVALLGFKVTISVFALPSAGIGFVMTFMKGARVRQWGEALLGFGLLFLGLGFLMDTVPGVDGVGQEAWVQQLPTHGMAGVVAFVLIGTVLTVVLQSSSATMMLTLALAALGWLPYELAAAMVLGENIGTTATANLAAIGTPVGARRAARAHLLFNFVGVCWALLLLQVYLLPVVDWLLPGDPTVDFAALQGDEQAVAEARTTVTLHLAMFHSLFNLSNTLLLLPLVGRLERVLVKWVPDDDTPPKGTLKYLGTQTLIDTPELVLVAAAMEMQRMVEVNASMLKNASHILSNPDEHLGDLVEETLAREEVVDDLERQINHHLALTARAATSASAARKIAAMVQNTHRLERIGDHCAVLVRIAARLRDGGKRMEDPDIARLDDLAALVQQSLAYVGQHMVGADVTREAELLEARIDDLRRSLREEHVDRLRGGEQDVAAGLAYLDLLTHYEEIGDRAVGIIRHAEYTASL